MIISDVDDIDKFSLTSYIKHKCTDVLSLLCIIASHLDTPNDWSIRRKRLNKLLTILEIPTDMCLITYINKYYNKSYNVSEFSKDITLLYQQFHMRYHPTSHRIGHTIR